MFQATCYSELTKIRDGFWIDLSDIKFIMLDEDESDYLLWGNSYGWKNLSIEDGKLIEAALELRRDKE